MFAKKENRWYVWLTVLLILVVITPYIIGFAIQTDELHFSGSFIGVDDQNSYLAKMRYGYEGNWLYRSPYTNFPQKGIVAFLPFILLGKLAGGKELVGQFQFLLLLMRVGTIALYIYSLKTFFSKLLVKEILTKFAVIFSILGGGFGFIYFIGLNGLWGGGLPLEVYSPESFSFLALLTLPHIIIARSFMLLALTRWFNRAEVRIGKLRIRYEVVTALYGYVVYIFQPITLPILLAIIGIYLVFQIFEDLQNKIPVFDIIKQQYLRQTILFIVLMLPAILYNLYLLLFDPYVIAWGKQNILTTAPILDYLLAYVVYLIIGAYYFGKGKDVSIISRTLAAWIVISLIGIYLPISIQRRFIEGSWIFIVLFFTMGLEKMKPGILENNKIRIGIYVFCLTSFFIFFGSILQVTAKPARVFISDTKFELFQFIDNNMHQKQYIFANHDIGNEIPVWTKMNTITGVGPESINELNFLESYDLFLENRMDTTSFERILLKNNVHYYILEINKDVHCNVLFSNSEYLLCEVGDYE
jgi:hypothetical protein